MTQMLYHSSYILQSNVMWFQTFWLRQHSWNLLNVFLKSNLSIFYWIRNKITLHLELRFPLKLQVEILLELYGFHCISTLGGHLENAIIYCLKQSISYKNSDTFRHFIYAPAWNTQVMWFFMNLYSSMG